ncbi:hypothetical protein QJS04_geneDACA000228 [Acorus gramineus]|uniref:DUF4283 domain-containing protein n=1 Tax=Acorus gramineus TaxID=55184 RepID=A0AAV9ART3_ACOGR|nr:hypothetical protein QJS04_geneDACA000228 [Acorus gramineus]
MFFKFSTDEDMIAVLTGAPWIILDHLLCLQQWRDNFDPSTAAFEITPVRIRFPNLPLDFWDGLTLIKMAAYAGTPVQVETTVEDVGRCRYTRALVEVDLRQPLCPGIWIGTEHRWQSFVYESIPQVCQICGRITHPTNKCNTPLLERSSTTDGNQSNVMTESSESVYAVESTQDNHKESTNGSRKVVPQRRRNHPKVVKEEGLVMKSKQTENMGQGNKNTVAIQSNMKQMAETSARQNVNMKKQNISGKQVSEKGNIKQPTEQASVPKDAVVRQEIGPASPIVYPIAKQSLSTPTLNTSPEKQVQEDKQNDAPNSGPGPQPLALVE